MRSLSFALLLCTLLLSACNRQKQEEQKAAAPSSKVILSTTVAPGSTFKLSVSFDPPQPLMSKKTKFTLKVADASGAPVDNAKVNAALVMPLMDMGKNEFPLAAKGGGTYEGTGQFTMSGEWEVVCTATSKDGRRTLSGKTTFNVRVED